MNGLIDGIGIVYNFEKKIILNRNNLNTKLIVLTHKKELF